MIYNSKYINLELNQIARTSNSGTLAIKISRNNPYYYNREGVKVVIEETVDGQSFTTVDHIYSWFTKYNPKNQDMEDVVPYDGDLNNPPPIIEDDTFYIDNLNFSISMINADTTKRVGKKLIKIMLIENNTEETIIVEGTIMLETLEIPEPVIHSINIKAVDNQLVVDVKGINPSNKYTLEVSNNFQGVIGTGSDADVTYKSTIISSWYKETITYSVKWKLDGDIIKEERKSFTVPSLELGFRVKYNDEWRTVKAIYVKENDKLKSVSDAYFKSAGEFLTQE